MILEESHAPSVYPLVHAIDDAGSPERRRGVRLYDHLIAGDYSLHVRSQAALSKVDQEAMRDGIARSLPGAVRFDITNVAKFFYEESEQSEWFWRRDFPTLAPPYDSFWMEYEAGDTVNRGGKVVREQHSIARVGILFLAYKGGNGWVVDANLFFQRRGEKPAGPVFTAKMTVLPDGSLTADPLILNPFPSMSDFEREVVQQSVSALFPAALAISFCHCKNVSIDDAPPSVSRQQRRQEEREGKHEAKFKTLVIGPMRRVLKTEGRQAKNGLPKALHICRGHFKNYSEDKPRFGREGDHGMFWTEPHVRGSADVGTVYKDYKVKP